MIIKHPVLTLLASCVIVLSSLAACAAEPTYNPDNLPAGQFTRVADICQNVMGLSPNERLEGGYWMGNDRLDYWTSHYRGCIVSLSDSLQNAMDDEATRQADADCRAKGYQPGSPDLALCVLHSVNSHSKPAPAQATSGQVSLVSEQLPTASGSFLYASPHENARREEVACAALGLEPSHGAFKSCVKGLNDTFYSIDHPIN